MPFLCGLHTCSFVLEEGAILNWWKESAEGVNEGADGVKGEAENDNEVLAGRTQVYFSHIIIYYYCYWGVNDCNGMASDFTLEKLYKKGGRGKKERRRWLNPVLSGWLPEHNLGCAHRHRHIRDVVSPLGMRVHTTNSELLSCYWGLTLDIHGYWRSLIRVTFIVHFLYE
jgi:hypothetical protein